MWRVSWDKEAVQRAPLLPLPTQHPHHPIQVAHLPLNPQHLHSAQDNQHPQRRTRSPLPPLQPTDRRLAYCNPRDRAEPPGKLLLRDRSGNMLFFRPLGNAVAHRIAAAASFDQLA